MQNQNADVLINEADRLLEVAGKEMQRSEEDVIAHLVCYNTRQSIVNYLSSFLLKNGIDLQSPVTINSLLEQCRREDDRFLLVRVDKIFCSHDKGNEAYCTNYNKVNDCLEIAKRTRVIALSDSPHH